ncbi:MAG: LysR family transcriptional regulator, partial [Gemmatimonadetes bacterium]|nr:LysR family transcriptional regulator [Gemmatimonadota bacterium]
KDTPAREQFAAFFTAHGLPEPGRIIECSSLVAIRGVLLMSDRVAVLSARQAQHELAAGDLAVLGPPLPGTCRAIGLTRRTDWHPTIVQACFLRILRTVSMGYRSQPDSK